MDKGVVCTYRGVRFSRRKGWNNAICSNVDGPRNSHTQAVRQRKTNTVWRHSRVHACSSLQLCLTVCDPVDPIVHQAHLSMRFSGQEHWSGLPCCPPGDLPGPETKHTSLASPALWADSLPLSHLGSPISLTYGLNFLKKWYKLFAKYKQTHWFKDRLIVTKGEELIRSLWLACTHYCIQSGWPTRTSCIAQGTLLSVLW